MDPETYTLMKRQDYMNTAPQMIIALLRQLVEAGVKQADITVCDTLAYLVHEYYDILHAEFPDVRYVDYAGKFGRIQVKASSAPLYWSCRPQGKTPDYLPTCFAEAEYLINFANLKAHTCTGVTLCGKNHFGSLVRWPVQKGYYDMHRNSFSKQTKIYREQVDLMGHAHLGGKTVLYLIDGLTRASIRSIPRRANGPRRRSTATGRRACWPRRTRWPSTRWASISSGAEWDDFPASPAWTTISTRRPWRAIRPRGRSTTRTMPPRRSGWPASASTSTGTMPRRRSTPAIWEPAKGSSWWPLPRSVCVSTSRTLRRRTSFPTRPMPWGGSTTAAPT